MKLKSAMNITQKTKIRHRNELNQTLAQLPLPAKRVVYMALAPIDSRNPIENGRIFKIRADDFAAIADISVTLAYRQLKEGAKLLSASSLSLNGNDIVSLAEDLGLPYSAKNKPSQIDLSITDYCAYFNNEGYLELRFSRTIEPYISSLLGEKYKFTTQLLMSSMRLSNQYSSALYQLVRKNYSSFKRKNKFSISLINLKDELAVYKILPNGDIEYKYPDFPIFKRDILKKSVAEIKKKTEISFLEFTETRSGRKVSNIVFEFLINEDVFSGKGIENNIDIDSLSKEEAGFIKMFDEEFPSE
ncbi:replication initiation protein [Xenorhabdus ishibashii]|uniref:RepB family plasmid replication initiator protein n=1 Tax=Xenorhabdus ishibashii TaxID=1034471 RepID=A0A2D0K7U3_9GAMM|nr:replication initiation protein [Xenorhabdus ishibashii]PHM59516.1 RepB family plasmid replication initiator protein [Xenorhabdus ishibashii]